MMWSCLVLVPLLACVVACLPLGGLQRASLSVLAWLLRAGAVGGLALLGVLLLGPQWLPADAVQMLDDWLRLPAPGAAESWRVAGGLLYATAATLVVAPLLALLDFTRGLGRHESNCRTLTGLMRHTVHLAENARALPHEAAVNGEPTPQPVLSPKNPNSRLRPLSELLG